jgi:Domain of unknown function (DUF6748)
MRILLVAIAAALPVLVGAGVSTGAAHQDAGDAFYVVRPDPRACPSPRCGGYWIAVANRDLTRCENGVLRPRCYVANAVGPDGEALPRGIPDGALVRGSVEKRSIDGMALGMLVVSALRTPTGQAATPAPRYRVRDTGIRCVRAPCFFMRAWRLSTRKVATVSELDLGPAGLTQEQGTEAESALQKGGLFVAGRIVRASDGGRSLRATTVYLSP